MIGLIGNSLAFIKDDQFTRRNKNIFFIPLHCSTVFKKQTHLARVLFVAWRPVTGNYGIFIVADRSPKGSDSIFGYHVYVYDTQQKGWVLRGTVPLDRSLAEKYWFLKSEDADD